AVIDAPEADITTGNILYTGRRVHRKGNELKLNVKALPPGPANAVVGRWRLSREVSQTDVALGEPVQVKLTLEGRGNLQSVTLPPLNPPAAFRAFDPETADKPNNSRSHVGGTRVVEYTLVPQQTGSFVLPEIVVPYFDPETRKYDEMRVDDITITVRPGQGGANVIGTPNAPNNTLDGPKNQLVGGGLKSLRHSAKFEGAQKPLSAAPWFLPVALAPVVLSMLAFAFGFMRNSLGQTSPEALKKKEARAARKRLAAAEKLLTSGSTTAFYEEVERALSGFMTAKLGTPTSGLTRAELTAKLTEAKVAETDRARILAVLDLCDLGRYAPGMGEASARRKAIDDAAAAMEGWS
ncbi:MAG: BatD family protein, partial [Archangium sp.]